MVESNGDDLPERDTEAPASGDTFGVGSDASGDTSGVGSDASGDTFGVGSDASGDTFGVGIHVTDTEFQFVVHVPSDIDSGWTDPEAFQRMVERTVWERLDREATLREIGERATVGETVTLGRVTLQPDGTVVDTEFRAGAVKS